MAADLLQVYVAAEVDFLNDGGLVLLGAHPGHVDEATGGGEQDDGKDDSHDLSLGTGEENKAKKGEGGCN